MFKHPCRFILFPVMLSLAATGGRDASAMEPGNTPPDKESRAAEKQPAPAVGDQQRNAVLAALVKSANYAYTTRADGVLEIIADDGDNPLVVLATETSSFTRKPSNEEVKIGFFICKVHSLEPEVVANPPAELLHKLNAFNNHFIPGKCFVNRGSNPGVFYQSSFWLASATASTIDDELTNAYLRRTHLRRSLHELDEPAKSAPAAPKVAKGPSSTVKKENAATLSAGMEALLKAGNYTYSKRPEGVLEIIAANGDDPLIVLGEDSTAFTKKNGEHVKTGVLFFKAVSLKPELAQNPPIELLRKVDQINAELNSGVCVMSKHDPGIFFGSLFWLSNATADTLRDEFIKAYLSRRDLRKEIHETLDQSAPRPAEAPADEALALRYVPHSAWAVLAVRPGELLARAKWQPLARQLDELLVPRLAAAPKLENIAEVQCIVHGLLKEPLLVVRCAGRFDWKAFAAEGKGQLAAASIADKSYFRFQGDEEPTRPAFYLPDDRTIVFGPEDDLRRAISADGRGKPDWEREWKTAAGGVATAMIDLAALGGEFGQELKERPQPTLAAFAPIWRKGRKMVISANVDHGLALAASVYCANQDDAERVHDTMHAAIALARNELDETRRQAASDGGELAMAFRPLFGLADDALKQAKLTVEQSEVRYALEINLSEAVLAPAVVAAREAARSRQAMNNLKQIALGLNTYYGMHGHYPPPVVIGPDGKTPHSWRVALLPCIDQVSLFTQYKLDEPWDSENNKRVLAQMPSAYRHPNAAAGTLESSYFALVGPVTAFGPEGGKGTRFKDMPDGVSNTIAVVEAKRSVPWTKPEDIAYDPDKPLPSFGGWLSGGFFAAFFDGNVDFFKDSIDESMLRSFITKAGGEPVRNP